MDNVNLSEPILSRFDNLCVVKDNTAEDEILAKFVLESHYKKVQAEHTSGIIETSVNKHVGENIIAPELLAQYILKARQINPTISDVDKNKLAALYSDLRHASQNGTIVTARHVESMVRLSEAFARMRL